MDRDLDGAGYAAGVKRVTWPYVISILGGLLILIEGVVVAVVSPFIATEGGIGPDALLFGVAVIVQGLIIIWAGWGLRRFPNRHVVLGVVIVVLSMVSMLLAGGGFIIGSVLGIVGGGWAMMSFEPTAKNEWGE
ncbi:DUF6114 domain-containing protein [Methanomassiliicoccus luminyensis]|jgi:hypothetical protein|uniref:DUF6114 domain-containing protein n=1 Tax=Methanomassiliicoccus luminyensis TaxID=1080712 RepID=UPI0003719776|nr:DUF6114 domain-containing protein [Methanomassiliicoccus luminyensis]